VYLKERGEEKRKGKRGLNKKWGGEEDMGSLTCIFNIPLFSIANIFRQLARRRGGKEKKEREKRGGEITSLRHSLKGREREKERGEGTRPKGGEKREGNRAANFFMFSLRGAIEKKGTGKKKEREGGGGVVWEYASIPVLPLLVWASRGRGREGGGKRRGERF